LPERAITDDNPEYFSNDVVPTSEIAMWKLWTVSIALSLPFAASAQAPKVDPPKVEAPTEPPITVVILPRFGVIPNPRLFPQTSPKDALFSAIKAIESERYEFLAAYIVDEKVIEAKIVERARQIERDVELDVRTKQIQQREKPASVTPLEQIPNEPQAFSEFVKQEARIRGYRLVVKDLADKFSADPTIAKELRKYLREGDFTVDGETAKATLKDVKDRGVFFKKAGERWFVEDRQIEVKPIEKAAEKKE